MTSADAVEVYYDPYDFDIDDDPYPIWRRLRDEAPLYYNEKYNFYALSRYDDVARELPNWEIYRSGRGTTMDIILSGIESSARGNPVRGPTNTRPSSPFAVKGFHTAADGGDRAADAAVLCARARPLDRLGPVRLHRRHRRDDSDADDRLPAGDSRTEPGDNSRQLERVHHAEGWRVRWSSRGPVRKQLRDVRRLHRLAGATTRPTI